MKMTRRYFLKTTGALAAYCGVAPLETFAELGQAEALKSLPKTTKGKTLVAIFLRGGMDGLSFIVPYADEHYYKLRNKLAVAPPGKGGAVDLDGFFGLHPEAKALLPLFASGQAAAIQAVGYDHNTRSHFKEQDVWETGVVGNTISSDGWLNRHLLTSEGHSPVRAVSIGDNLPRILRGNAPAYAIRGVTDLTMPDSHADKRKVAAALEHAYCTQPSAYYNEARDLLAQTAQATLEGIKQIEKLGEEKYAPQASYPESSLGNQLKEAAHLIKSNIGVELIEIDYSGWDMHSSQDRQFAPLAKGLADALAAFCADLEGRMDDVLVLTMSDFGRTAFENGNLGTDHGWANCMLALGGPVLRAGKGKARPILGQWPGLAPEQLHEQRDLLHTTDFRDVLGEVVKLHLGNENLQKILPQHQFASVGLIA